MWRRRLFPTPSRRPCRLHSNCTVIQVPVSTRAAQPSRRPADIVQQLAACQVVTSLLLLRRGAVAELEEAPLISVAPSG